VLKTERRRFTAEYGLRILAESLKLTHARNGANLGSLALGRAQPLAPRYVAWAVPGVDPAEARAEGRNRSCPCTTATLTPQKRGPKPDPQAVEITRLRRESERLLQAEKIIETLPESSQRWSTGRAATKSQAWRSIRTDESTSLNPMAALIVACRDTVYRNCTGLDSPVRTAVT